MVLIVLEICPWLINNVRVFQRQLSLVWIVGSERIVPIEQEGAHIIVLKSRRHQQQVTNRNVLKPWVAFGQFGQVVGDRIVDVVDIPFLNGDAYQS